eukprot:3433741-Pyramimonas_sp.AAC.1
MSRGAEEQAHECSAVQCSAVQCSADTSATRVRHECDTSADTDADTSAVRLNAYLGPLGED